MENCQKLQASRKMPSRSKIIDYWVAGAGADILNSHGIELYNETDYENCFACGDGSMVERCHILARCEGGSDTVDNLHLLCQSCHKKSEYFSGETYWKWLSNENINNSKFPSQHTIERMVLKGFDWTTFFKFIEADNIIMGHEYISQFLKNYPIEKLFAVVLKTRGLNIDHQQIACINALSLPCDDLMLSVTKILEVFNTYKEAILFSCQYIPNTVVNPIAPMRALLAKAYYYEDRSRLEEFLRIYATGHVKHASEDTAAIALRNSWQKMKENDTATMTYARRIDWYLKCQLALSHFLKGRDIKNLQKTKAVFDHYPLPGIQKETADVIKRLKHFNR